MKRWISLVLTFGAVGLATAQDPQPPRPEGGPPPPPDGFAPPPGGRGPGGPGGPNQPELKVRARFDTNKDKRLDVSERKPAREYVKEQRQGAGAGGPGGRRGPPGGRPRESVEAPSPGPNIKPADVPPMASGALYDPKLVRTLFLQFENTDWEKELEDFHNTDVEVPAVVIVDNHTFPDVGVHFRGASSYFMLPTGSKRSLNLSFDEFRDGQNLVGSRTLNLLNSHTDATFLRTVLYSEVAREYLPALKANFMRVVINGESWGLYVSLQQFNNDFIQEAFHSSKGARWKTPGSPRGSASLTYLGEDPDAYRKIYELKSKEDLNAWKALIRLCKTLTETPAEDLQKALEPMLDIEGTLRFLAVENALINNDGYWVRASDYHLYLDESGKFHLIPGDTNETFSRPGGPGFGGGRGRGGPGGPRREQAGADGPRPDGPPGADGPGPRPPGGPRIAGVQLDPLVAAKDEGKLLLSKLLSVPALRTRYLTLVRDIATKWLDWNVLGPKARAYHGLIAEHVKADTRKLASYEAFEKGLAGEEPAGAEPGRRGPMSLKTFADQRRAYLLEHPEIKSLSP